MKQVKFGQVWLAKLSYFCGNPEFTAVIKISGKDERGIWFRNLESEEVRDVKRSNDMNLFELIRKIKD